MKHNSLTIFVRPMWNSDYYLTSGKSPNSNGSTFRTRKKVGLLRVDPTTRSWKIYLRRIRPNPPDPPNPRSKKARASPQRHKSTDTQAPFPGDTSTCPGSQLLVRISFPSLRGACPFLVV